MKFLLNRRGLFRENSGQSLIEIALMMPMLILLMAYAIDFGYFFMAAANITSAARNGTQYSIMGYQGPAQSGLPVAGSAATTTSVVAIAMADLTSLSGSSTTTTVQVCSKSLGMSGHIPNCTSSCLRFGMCPLIPSDFEQTCTVVVVDDPDKLVRSAMAIATTLVVVAAEPATGRPDSVQAPGNS